ncbi:membrane protein, partial [Streptomyces sp. MBRL 10]
MRRQAVTTALLPAAGFPVLALATALHAVTPLRDAAFVLVVFCGVYARRWGARGHALGIFAFMNFFITQFLHALPGQLPELYAAVDWPWSPPPPCASCSGPSSGAPRRRPPPR